MFILSFKEFIKTCANFFNVVYSEFSNTFFHWSSVVPPFFQSITLDNIILLLILFLVLFIPSYFINKNYSDKTGKTVLIITLCIIQLFAFILLVLQVYIISIIPFVNELNSVYTVLAVKVVLLLISHLVATFLTMLSIIVLLFYIYVALYLFVSLALTIHDIYRHILFKVSLK